MTGAEIIAKFELYVDDLTELSSDEELDLLNAKYEDLYGDRPYEWLKKEFSGTTDGTTTIDLPTDFQYFLENTRQTDNSEDSDDISAPKAIFVGTFPNDRKYRLVNWSDRRQYQNRNEICWVDQVDDKLEFSIAPASGLAVSGDYAKIPTDITLSTEPEFPTRFHKWLYHEMAVDSMIIQLFPKARSYADFNQSMANQTKARLDHWNANLQND